MLSRELDRTLDRVDFLEHKLRTLELLVSTQPGLTLRLRERLLSVLSAETYVEVETMGD